MLKGDSQPKRPAAHQAGKSSTTADWETLAAACRAPLLEPPHELPPTAPRVSSGWTARLREASTRPLRHIRITLRSDGET